MRLGHNNYMSDFTEFFRRKSSGDEPHPRRCPEYPEPISTETLKNIFAGCGDFQTREVDCGLLGRSTVTLCWLDGVVGGSDLSSDVLRPLTDFLRTGGDPSPERLLSGAVYSGTAQRRDDTDSLVTAITQGCCAVVFDEQACAVTFEIRSPTAQRSIGEPTVEKSLKGGKDSFVETLRTNTALVRKRICNPALKLKSSVVGRKSRTNVAVMYVDGVADPAVVAELRRRLSRIDIDGALATGSIEEYIVDRPRSPFPQLLHTERPDRFSRQLLNGRVGLIVDGLPIGFLLPVTFAEFLRVPQDDSQHFLINSALSVIRWFATVIALILPAMYVAIAMYHQEMIPTKLLVSVIESKKNVPFPTSIEVLGMLVAFELLQEAGLRLPNPIGDTVSIIGALIVGQSAVEASVISPIAVIVVAFAGICGFAQPSQDLGAALRLGRFLLVLAAILSGLFGVTALLCFIVWYLCTMDSFGVNYTAPLSDGRPGALARAFLRKPKKEDKFREAELNTPDRRNQK